MVYAQALILTFVLLLSTGATAHPNHSCHSHGATQHCR
jgi:hypothetical protein